jgi:hypothetical protein
MLRFFGENLIGVPFGTGGLVIDVSSYISNLIIIQTTSEGRHGVFAVSNLVYDGGLFQTTS